MYWRILYGFIRAIFGLVLFKVVNVPFTDLFYSIMSYELMEDPTDSFYQSIGSFLQMHPFSISSFAAFYLVFWGVVDVVLSISLLKRKVWAFPISIGLIVLFTAYEIYRFSHTHSLLLLSVIVLDACIASLIWKEYRKIKR